MTSAPTATKTYYNENADVEYLRRPARNNGDVVILLHGVGSNAHSFEPLIKTLSPDLDIIAWNAPGYGNSRRLIPEYPTPRDYAVVLKALLDSLRLSKVTLVGHSLGALFAGSFAVLYPECVQELALLSPGLGYSVAPGAQLPEAVQLRIDEATALGPADFARKRAPGLISDPAAKPHLVLAVEKAMSAINLGGYTQAVRALGAANLLADLKIVRAPTLVAVGENDRVTTPEYVRPAYECLLNPAEFRLVADAGHALPQEQPEVVARLLEGLIGLGETGRVA